MYGAEPCAARAFAPVLAGVPKAAAWPVAATAASVPPSNALTDTAMTRMNRVLRDKGARLMVGSRMIFLKAPADLADFGFRPRSPHPAIRRHSGVSQSAFP
jgi:hypothetical protein